ncbi:AraC family transcriptional regulator [Anaerocolumna cellulosilytica]|uniref:AraC family transcriptional regulator n=1 Tax=Anaerocolumna cellulosilytica TaxID=433286 RepID=A0A6S6R174_9FIRM|nr:zinc ribbon domain-containing protein [Anaerocolumna cellulosilytica]MBB5195683.1 dihydrodipicolinate reductase [Anaerocolumna cellulosilytica]BCJ92981.1 AraC family transcriptional regulator [Anaerocolumna cellulosilytica]
MKICIACGMPMLEKSDFAGEDTKKDYCIHCTRPDGSMQSFEEKKAGMIHFIIKTQGFDYKAATKIAESNMKRLPAWKDCFNTEV